MEMWGKYNQGLINLLPIICYKSQDLLHFISCLILSKSIFFIYPALVDTQNILAAQNSSFCGKGDMSSIRSGSMQISFQNSMEEKG